MFRLSPAQHSAPLKEYLLPTHHHTETSDMDCQPTDGTNLAIVSAIQSHALVPKMLEERRQDLVLDVLRLHAVRSATLLDHLDTTADIMQVTPMCRPSNGARKPSGHVERRRKDRIIKLDVVGAENSQWNWYRST